MLLLRNKYKHEESGVDMFTPVHHMGPLWCYEFMRYQSLKFVVQTNTMTEFELWKLYNRLDMHDLNPCNDRELSFDKDFISTYFVQDNSFEGGAF